MNKRIPLLFMLLLAPLILFSCGGGPKPSDTLKQFGESLQKRDWNTVWGCFSSKSQKDFEVKIFNPIKEKLSLLPPTQRKVVNYRLGIDAEKLLSMSAKDYFMLVMDKTDASLRLKQRFNPETLIIEQETIEKNQARVRLKGDNHTFSLVREFGVWKLVWEL
jgi:hypothetical protein